MSHEFRTRKPCPTCERTCECDGLTVEINKTLSPVLTLELVRTFGALTEEMAQKILDTLDDSRSGPGPGYYEVHLMIVAEHYQDEETTV